jgi:hypothetical protein
MCERVLYNRREALTISFSATIAGVTVGLLATAAPGEDDEKTKPAATIQAKPEDVGSIDAVVGALYGAISGPAGRRDLDRLRSLFRPEARLIVCVAARREDEKGMVSMRAFTVDEFVAMIEPRVKTEGFFEREISRSTERFGSVAHVFSTYESRRRRDDQEPFARGINSIQLFFDGKRWWLVTVFWDSERPGQSIPKQYLPKRGA